VFASAIHFHSSLIVLGKARSLPVEWGNWLHLGRIHEWAVGNTLAYYDTATNATVKSFKVQAQGYSFRHQLLMDGLDWFTKSL
jgi:hypothetical protein